MKFSESPRKELYETDLSRKVPYERDIPNILSSKEKDLTAKTNLIAETISPAVDFPVDAITVPSLTNRTRTLDFDDDPLASDRRWYERVREGTRGYVSLRLRDLVTSVGVFLSTLGFDHHPLSVPSHTRRHASRSRSSS